MPGAKGRGVTFLGDVPKKAEGHLCPSPLLRHIKRNAREGRGRRVFSIPDRPIAPDVYTTFVYTTAGQLADSRKFFVFISRELPRLTRRTAPDRPGFGSAKLLIIGLGRKAASGKWSARSTTATAPQKTP